MHHAFQDDPYVAANPENLPFWQAAEEGRFVGKTCSDCGKFHWYPRAVCPTLRRASPPYTVAYVQLAEGPMVLTNLVDMSDTPLAIGLPVQVVFRRTEDGRNAPKFTLAT